MSDIDIFASNPAPTAVTPDDIKVQMATSDEPHGYEMTTMIQLQDRAIATLRKVLPQGRKGMIAYRAAQKRFDVGMLALGFRWEDQARIQAWGDSIDMANLKNAAA